MNSFLSVYSFLLHCNEKMDYYLQLIKEIEEPRYHFSFNRKLEQQKDIDLKTYSKIL